MNTQTQNQSSKTKMPNLEAFGKQLHDLGDKIERIAEKLKADGVAESKELYAIGNEVEHFCDQLTSGAKTPAVKSNWTAPGADDLPTKAQKDSSSTVNTGQASG